MNKFLNNLDISKLEKFENPRYITGIYFLFKNNEIIYIGKSNDIFARVLFHQRRGNKDFDFFKYIVIDEKFLNQAERFFIEKFYPALNKDPLTIKQKRYNEQLD